MKNSSKFNFKTDSKSLYKTILLLKTTKECECFFRDLCTLSELKSMTERWEIVLKLQEKKSYRQIAEETGASTTTVTRVAHWIENGEGGYKAALSRIKKSGCHSEL